jgi:hypothetical protein
MSTDPRTPAEVADWLTEKATDARGIAFSRYPRERSSRLADETAQLRLLVEQAAEHLRQFDREITCLRAPSSALNHAAPRHTSEMEQTA